MPTTPLSIARGKTFSRVLRYASAPFIYAAITGITKAGPARITAVAHGIVQGWPVAVVSAGGMRQINAENDPPRLSEFKRATVVDANTVTLNAVNSSGFTTYTSGGYLQYLTPASLAGATVRMTVWDRAGGTQQLALDSDALGGIAIDDTAKTITVTLDADDSDALTWNGGYYEIEIESVSGAVKLLGYGPITVTPTGDDHASTSFVFLADGDLVAVSMGEAGPTGATGASDATLAAIAALITAADQVIYATGVDTFAMTSFTAAARTFAAAASTAAQRTALGLAIGTNVQAYASNLDLWAAVAPTAYATLLSPALTGTPTAPTAADLTNTTQLATTQYTNTRVANAVADLVASSPAALDTLDELAAALGDDANFATTTATALGNRLRIDTAAQGLSGTQQGNGLTNLGFSANAISLVQSADYAAMRTALSLTALATTAPGTGVATALALNVGTAGALVVNGGALGTPSSGVATNLTGTASGLTAGAATLAAAATALASGRTISITGDLAYTSPSFDGSGNVTAASTLATVNSNVGSFTNASLTVNAKGLVTAASSGSAGAVLTANSFTATQSITPANNAAAIALSANTTGVGTLTTNGSGSVTGVGTSFLSQLRPGDTITPSGQSARVVSFVSSDTTLNLTVSASGSGSGLAYTITPVGASINPNGSFSYSPHSYGAGNTSTRYGAGALAAGAQSLAVGTLASSAGTNGTAIGYGATVTTQGIAIGYTAAATGGIAIGESAATNDAGSATAIAIGYGATTSTRQSIAIGRVGSATTPSADGQLIIGTDVISAARISDVWIGGGRTSATPLAVTYRATSGAGTDIVGAGIAIAAGNSTGTAAGGNVSLKTAPTTNTTGTTANAVLDREIVVAQGKALTSGAAASLFEVALPTLAMAGGLIRFNIICSNGTDMQSLAGEVVWSAVNKGGAYTVAIKTPGGATADDSTCAKSVSTGTLTLAWAVTSGTNKVTLQATPTTSLTPTSFKLYYSMENHSEQAITVL